MNPAQLARETLKTLAAQRIEPTAENYSRIYNELAGTAKPAAPRTDASAAAISRLLAQVRALLSEDDWLAGQIDAIRKSLSATNANALQEAEERLRQLAAQQGMRRSGLSEARETLKKMVSTFVDQMAQVTRTTGEYGEQVGELSKRVSNAKDISELGSLLSDLSGHTQSMQSRLAQNREELLKARAEVEATQEKMRSLESEVVTLSEQVREDPLTRALNRRGLEDAFKREAARSTRHATPLSVGLIDIDHFKKLNDTYGHEAGDQALKHLTSVIRESMRPTDQLARTGGEEFVLILPDTNAENAKVALVRLQRELTKRMFLQQDQRWLITFSAGVTNYTTGEELKELLIRADAALYQAKQQGRNLVLVAGGAH
jgi:diguanylate cyclase